MSFESIAIVGRSCLLPGALSPAKLWEAVASKRDLMGRAPAGRWGMTPQHALRAAQSAEGAHDAASNDRGGYVEGFDTVFDPHGFFVSAEEILKLDPLFQWVLHTGREALNDVKNLSPARTGAIFGNLSFPSSGMSQFAQNVWLGEDKSTLVGLGQSAPQNRFMSGLPADYLHRALGLGVDTYCLDAACASSLYAIKLACHALQDGKADVMLAGAVNRADDLFIHVGFTALNALSPSGESRPFHPDADGLVPAEGAGFVALKRLADAKAHGDTIYGVIRGVGVSNDGRGSGLLAPSADGQIRAMRAAYTVAGMTPEDVSYLECHATGTTVGDATELESMASVFQNGTNLAIGSLKSNMGHAITAAGVAGLLKILGAFEHKTLPPSLGSRDNLSGSGFRVVRECEPWESVGPRRAGLSAFGFGGNNAHLIVEEYDAAASVARSGTPPKMAPLAVVGIGSSLGEASQTVDVAGIFLDNAVPIPQAQNVELPLKGLRFPPNDLKQTLAQQLLVLRTTHEAIEDTGPIDPEKTAVLVGMGCDPNVARFGARWRLAQWQERLLIPAQELNQARNQVVSVLESPGVLGTMPNICANRINSQFDISGFGYAVSAEELSGIRALQIAMRSLRVGEVETAVVAAVDLSCEEVHEAALGAMGRVRKLADGALTLVLERLDVASAKGRDIYATIVESDSGDVEFETRNIMSRVGEPHAASGLFEVLGGVLHANAESKAALSSAPICKNRRMRIQSMGGQETHVAVASHGTTRPLKRYLAGEEKTLRFSAHMPSVTMPARQREESSMNMPTQEVTLLPLEPDATMLYVMGPAPQLETSLVSAMDEQQTMAAAASCSLEPSRGSTATQPVAKVVTQRPVFHGEHSGLTRAQTRFHAAQSRVQARLASLQGRAQSVLGRALPQFQLSSANVVVVPKAVATQPDSLPMSPPAGAHPITPLKVQATPEAKPPIVVGASLPGLNLSREELMVHADGNISEIFGPLFAKQDGYTKQVRMPKPPLLLADRVVGLDAEPGSMGLGTIWTETDVTSDAWYMHEGRMPAGIMIEAGQADLMLISYLGIDFLNQGERVYRLLGCELTYHEHLPQPGETLQYEIHVDGHATQGDVRLFFFHYDCLSQGKPRLSVRGGQAGFFTEQELLDSKGVIWDAETAEHEANPRLDEPKIACARHTLSRGEIEAFANGRPQDCFGPGFEFASTHTASPRIAAGEMCFLDDVSHLETRGGPWQGGYLRGTQAITPTDWFFEGHFKNDSCMPGTLMFEGCLQAMAIFVGSLGYTLERDGWRFEPVPEETYQLRCRGQVLRSSKELVYEVFVEEVFDGPIPTLYADLLCTVDGLKAFHCRRMGLRLVPDWPLEKLAELNPSEPDPLPVAVVDGFKFDYPSLLACAWGKPSKAFGKMYEVFDQTNRVARLPGPPYHFMSRIAKVEGPIGGMQAGTCVEVEYDIPEQAYYFDENGSRVMPFCVLLEAALQPCGWLASYVGSALTSADELFFRNLDGTGTLKSELIPAGGTLRTKATITNISQSAGMIIESFTVQCFVSDVEVYELNTVFGFFPGDALANQKGLDVSLEQAALLLAPCAESVDLRAKPPRYCSGGARLARDGSLMLDRVTGAWAEGGSHGLGRYRSEKFIDHDAWFFKAHFFQDPVQPGSLGIEAMVQLLQFAMLHTQMDEGIEHPRFEPLALNEAMSWKYRGQVRPHNKVMQVTLDITQKALDARGPYAVADASLWVDGMRIYEATGLAMRIVSDGTAGPTKLVETLDPKKDSWLADHRPTWTMPVLPMMSMVDRMAACAARGTGLHVVSVKNAKVLRWVPISEPTELSTTLSGEGPIKDVSLFEKDECIATCQVRVSEHFSEPPQPLQPVRGKPAVCPYESGLLFHGPAFQRLQSWILGSFGSSAVLSNTGTVEATGYFDEFLLDAATHGIIHDRLHLWSDEVSEESVAYPAWVADLSVYGPLPTQGEVRCETRFAGFVGSKRFPAFTVQLIAGERVWLEFQMVEALFAKGPLGMAQPLDRLQFLKERKYVEGIALSQFNNGQTQLSIKDVEKSDWLEGTIASIYGTTEPRKIAIKEHLAAKTGLHPGCLPQALPLSQFPLDIRASDEKIAICDSGEEKLDLDSVKLFWNNWFQAGRWPVEDIFYELAKKFVRRVVLMDPEGMAALKSKSVLYLANHQVGIESLLFSVIASGIQEIPTVTLAKAEHRESWLGKLIDDSFSYPGIRDPGVITFFDRDDRESLPKIIGELGGNMAEGAKSVMVHVEGTRSLSCRNPVQKMTGAFIDMAIEVGVPIVPLRFVGGLPTENLEQRIEFPIGMGQQDYYFGTPIMPEELAQLPYGERKKRVMDAINTLGPANQVEEPHGEDSAFCQEVSQWQATSQVSEDNAVLRQCLVGAAELSTESSLALEGPIRAREKWPQGAKGEWLLRLSQRLLGVAN